MNFAPESDKEILRSIRLGSTEGLDTFLNRYVPILSRYIELLAQDAQQSEQILSNTFSSFFRLEQIADTHSLVHLLHLAEDALLASQTLTPSTTELRVESTAVEAKQSDEVALYETLRRLPFEYQQIIVLNDVLGLDSETVAQALRLEVLEAQTLLRRGRRMLKRGFFRRVNSETAIEPLTSGINAEALDELAPQ